MKTCILTKVLLAFIYTVTLGNVLPAELEYLEAIAMRVYAYHEMKTARPLTLATLVQKKVISADEIKRFHQDGVWGYRVDLDTGVIEWKLPGGAIYGVLVKPSEWSLYFMGLSRSKDLHGDMRLMRKKQANGWATDDAMLAAGRFFNTVNMMGWTVQKVISSIGEPGEHYGNRLHYYFDDGVHRFEVMILLKKRKVAKVVRVSR